MLEASGPRTALEVARRHRGPIDLLAIDLESPRESEDRLVRELVDGRPRMKVLYFAEEASRTSPEPGKELPGRASSQVFLPRPFSPADLLGKVRKLIVP